MVTYADTLPAIGVLEGGRAPDLLITRTQYPEGHQTRISLALMAKMKCPGIKVVLTGEPELAEHAEGVGEFRPNPIDVPTLVDQVEQLLTDSKEIARTPGMVAVSE